MSVEEHLEQTRSALAQMWSDPEETAERLRQFLARTDPAAPPTQTHAAAPSHAAAHAPGATPAHRDEQRLALCHATAQTSTVRAWPGTGAPADPRTPGTPADRGSAAGMTDLVERARAGETDAFGRLYDEHSDAVYRYISFRVGGEALAEDLTSETFLRALRRIGTFTWQGRDFRAWLIAIARDLVADHFASRRFRLEITTADLLDAAEVVPSAEDCALGAVSAAALLEAVRLLTPRQQECVTLRFFLDLSVAETARVMGRSEAAVRVLQYRAVRDLARLLPGGDA
ncbi:sigma-70 family RNA polymerase sigma factor [Streptomyces sp. NPDC047014]|uniref:sigma-70 family RNA polymerase sigma factor n=1 Tax=Streptomyces sp. NPDC047014 TaxID=3155736 RepID=UPI0033C83E98